MRPDYRSLFSAQHGGAFDLMHDIDLALWYAGLPVSQVYALSGSYSDIGIAAPDVAEILIGFEGRGSTTAAWRRSTWISSSARGAGRSS